MEYQNLTIIGSSHIAQESVLEITKAIQELKPDIIAVELDYRRYYALLYHKHRKLSIWDIRKIGFKGYVFAVIGQYVQKTLGKYAGMEPGSDMLTAIKLAKQNNIHVALIDQDIEITLSRFSASLTWREKWNFIVDLFRAIFFRKSEMKALGLESFDLRKVPSKQLIEKLMRKLKKRYPLVYKVLITERNVVVANNLHGLMQEQKDKKILAVVGAGHTDDLIGLLKKYGSNDVDLVDPRISYSFKTNV